MKLSGKFKHYNQRFIVFQFPNLPLIIWFIAVGGARLFRHGFIHMALTIISLTALIIWGLLEIFFGSSYFRRVLGLAVLSFTLYTHFFR